MQDLLCSMLVSTDPIISSLRKQTHTKKKEQLNNETKSF